MPDGSGEEMENEDHADNMDLDFYLDGETSTHDYANPGKLLVEHCSIGRGPPRKAVHMGREKPLCRRWRAMLTGQVGSKQP